MTGRSRSAWRRRASRPSPWPAGPARPPMLPIPAPVRARRGGAGRPRAAPRQPPAGTARCDRPRRARSPAAAEPSRRRGAGDASSQSVLGDRGRSSSPAHSLARRLSASLAADAAPRSESTPDRRGAVRRAEPRADRAGARPRAGRRRQRRTADRATTTAAATAGPATTTETGTGNGGNGNGNGNGGEGGPRAK